MSQTIVIHWGPQTLQAVVVRDHQVTALVALPIEDRVETDELGVQLAVALAPHSPARGAVLVAVGRAELDWQHLSLPPCPADDLPDLVQMQSLQDVGAAGEETSFDFLPLTGDEQTPHQVLAIALAPRERDKIETLCRAAELKPTRIVPLAVGWPACVADSMATLGAVKIYVSPFASEPCIWADTSERIVLFRQIHLPAHDDSLAFESAIAAELRRTLLALSQSETEPGEPSIGLVGADPERLTALADPLAKELGANVGVAELAVTFDPSMTEKRTSIELPLAGLAIDEAAGNRPLVDLLHPRRRPAPRDLRRTGAIIGLAAAAAIGLIGWRGHAALQAPLIATEVAEAKLEEISKTSKDFQAAQRQAAILDRWNQDSIDVLFALEKVSQLLRTESLDAEPFPVEEDAYLKRLVVSGHEVVVDGRTRSKENVQSIETRLRDDLHHVHRQTIERNDEVADYPWHYELVIDVAPLADSPEEVVR